MGYYINPEDMSKEDWLSKHGNMVFVAPQQFDFDGDSLPVCLVLNPGFTAAGIAFNERELLAFNRPGDMRPKMWFTVRKEDLKPWYDPQS